MDTFHRTWIYCLICFLAGCAMGGSKKPDVENTLEIFETLCPNGVQKVEFETNDDGEQVIKYVTCFARAHYAL